MSNHITESELADFESKKLQAKSYTNGEVVVYWQADLCIHSANCVVGLPGVFNPQRRPWIKPDEATTEEIIRTINTCPTRALLYRRIQAGERVPPAMDMPTGKAEPVMVKILRDGPLLISGNFLLRDSENNPIPLGGTEVAAICRCGSSAKKPFCDGSHIRSGFKDE